jgi:beta-glucosidase
MKKLFIYLLCSITVLIAKAQLNTEAQAKLLVSKMTTEEKINLVVGTGMNIPFLGMKATVPDKVPGSAGATISIQRLGLPSMVVADGPAGLRIQPKRDGDEKAKYFCTAFPVGTLLASTWDVALVKKVGIAMGSEVKAYGVDVLLGPAMNTHRNPLGGRNFEYYSEDPVVAGNIAAAMINGIQSNGVGTSLKHFAANNSETNRNFVNTIISERALREIYLRGFEIAIKKSNPWTIMSSYNKINGTYASENYDLLSTILKKEWGYKGLVMTDWFGGKDAVAQMKAGNDLLMPGGKEQIKALQDAVNNKALDIKILDANAERIVRIVLESPTNKKYIYNNKPDLKANAIIARAAAAEGMILLKNENNVLPLNNKQKNIAAFGNISYDFISGGGGSGDVNEAYTISLVDGLKNAGITAEADVKELYQAYIKDAKAKRVKPAMPFELPKPIVEMEMGTEMVQKIASKTDIAFLTIGRNAGEFYDRKVENDYYLTEAEINLIKNVSATYHAQNKKLVVIINTGGVIDVSAWREYADAILLAWQGGQEAGNAVADIITGKINPSGKLATTFPANYNDDPTAKTFPGKNLSDVPVSTMGGLIKGFDAEIVYSEGVFVGYRYYNSFKVKPAYEFGYGLSYTNYTYENVKLSTNTFTNKITVSVTIKNTGTVAGKEVVQLYVNAPGKKMQKPLEELKAFGKTNLLLPGQSQTLQFEINAKDLASYDTEMNSWIVEVGNYNFKVGASSENIKQTISFMVPKEIIAEKCNKALSPQVKVEELVR